MSSSQALNDSSKLGILMQKYWQWRVGDSPEFATTLGLHDTDDKLEELSIGAYEVRFKQCQEFSKELQNINKDTLPRDGKLNYSLLEANVQSFLKGYQWRHYSAFNSINFLENTTLNFSSFIIDSMQFKSKPDFEKYLKRLAEVPRQLDEQMEGMREAMRVGSTYNAVSVNGAVQQFKSMLEQPASACDLMKPIQNDLDKVTDISDEEKQAIEGEALKVIKDSIFVATKKALAFLEDEYMKSCRQDLGVLCLSKGREFYDTCLQWHTTTNLTAEQVHELGLQEVSRICTNMERVKVQAGFSGNLADFFQYLKEDKQFYHSNEQDLMAEFRDIIDNVIPPLLVNFFEDIPDTPVIVKEMPFNGPGGQYLVPPMDGSKPGIFQANLHEPHTKPRFNMMSLCLHEASPGHHLQFAYSNLLDLPEFRKQFDHRNYYSVPCTFPLYTAYVEGWALYAEYLGEEMGAYRTPYELFGRYSDEMFRAARLVVDTGLHVFGWSKERAMTFLQDNTCVPEVEIKEEVDRYLTWPGQACAYKIGELKIKELREMAEKKLWEAFSVKAFHKLVLGVGPVPLDVLQEAVEDYINDTLAQ